MSVSTYITTITLNGQRWDVTLWGESTGHTMYAGARNLTTGETTDDREWVVFEPVAAHLDLLMSAHREQDETIHAMTMARLVWGD